ncbi:MAG: ABC transporter ATP-binding protein [Candidatus Glassbacteria bacterium]|nr:ABC transporter ATP-binding protein [Candidatus Glassbacteria bacterium]
MQNKAVLARDLCKDYRSGSETARVLKDVSFSVDHGEFCSLMGPSGSGKSTLLYLLGGLTHVSGGRIWLDGTELTGRNDGEITRLRYDKIGFVFQRFNLLPTLSAEANVEIATRLTVWGNGNHRNELPSSAELLDLVGLGAKLNRRPSELSIGEQQRVAIARALVRRPAILLADEPTGSLDRANTEKVLDILCRLNTEHGQSIILVTHDPEVAERGDRTMYLVDGQINGEGRRK